MTVRAPAGAMILTLFAAGWCNGICVAQPRAIGTLAFHLSPRIARCLIRREPDLIVRWLDTLPGSAEEDQLVSKAEPRFAACFDSLPMLDWRAEYDRPGMRAGLVRAMLQARRPNLPETLRRSDGDARWYVEPASPEKASRNNIEAIFAAELGICLATKHWPEVLAVIRTVDPEAEKIDHMIVRRSEVTRNREAAAANAAIAGLVSVLSACVPTGMKLRLDRPRLRAIVEEAAYHLTSAIPAASSETDPRATVGD